MATKKKTVVSKLKLRAKKVHSIQYEGTHEDTKHLQGVYIPKDLIKELTDDDAPENCTVTISFP